MASVGPLSGVDPAGKMRLRITNKQNKQNFLSDGLESQVGLNMRIKVHALFCSFSTLV